MTARATEAGRRTPAEPSAAAKRPADDSRTAKRTLADDAYAELKARIMRSELAPGVKLSIDGMAKELAFSQTPIREALARLESEGLLARRPLSGYTVAPLLSAAEFADLFDLRMMLEPLAARRAAECARASAAASGAAAGHTAAADGGEAGPGTAAGSAADSVAAFAADGGDAADFPLLLDAARTPEPGAGKLAFTAADRRFHDAVAALSGSAQIAKAIRRLDAHLHLHRAYIAPESISETEAEHLAVAEAIIAQQPLAAEAAMRRHLERSKVRHAAAFAAADALTAPKPKRARASR
ncbi:DNA-binding transcriptional regulator, GntR family [Glycomyces sambucus]|uniref:DNA-binding transcriptional regulator, GntR family n=1 Tax=Glycomyces sambucus TaxID=380244 RepID=A0A1G9M5H0_9ACTN|nr:GntR family transcriptional regulator [Glycomyces sambucus]SDL69191.1 DNA-binding transcriptional regulator, GntR family [Glycomyces sambucus]